MNAVEAALRTIAADLDRRAAGWALVGGFAVSIAEEAVSLIEARGYHRDRDLRTALTALRG